MTPVTLLLPTTPHALASWLRVHIQRLPVTRVAYRVDAPRGRTLERTVILQTRRLRYQHSPTSVDITVTCFSRSVDVRTGLVMESRRIPALRITAAMVESGCVELTIECVEDSMEMGYEWLVEAIGRRWAVSQGVDAGEGETRQ